MAMRRTTRRLLVSIADAKPIPWRRHKQASGKNRLTCFNRRREANPLATWTSASHYLPIQKFQSQTRSQPPGDMGSSQMSASLSYRFNRRREANPLATEEFNDTDSKASSFNRRREANPLATPKVSP